MDLFNFSPLELLSFYLTLFRVSVVLFMMPIFDSDSIPRSVKAALVLVMSLAVWPQLSFSGTLMPASPFEIAIMLFGEAVLGLALGLVVNIFFAAVRMGGEIIGFQMGFSMVSVMDPVSGANNTVTAHLLYMCTMLTFLSLNGHLFLVKALALTFDLVPPGGLIMSPHMVNTVLSFSGELFLLSLRIAAPVMAAIFLVDLALALISKAAPQMNVMMLGFPIKITVGFMFLGFIFSIMSTYVGDFTGGLMAFYTNMLRPELP